MNQPCSFTCELCGRDYEFGVNGLGDPVGYSRDVCSAFCDGRKQERALNRITIDNLKQAYEAAQKECAAKEAEIQRVWANYKSAKFNEGYEVDAEPLDESY